VEGPALFAGRYGVIRGEQPRKGGMATIYPCTDLEDGKRVAVKVIEPHREIDRLEETIFDRELNVKGLSHPNIVTLHDSGRLPDTGQYFLVFDWIDHDLVFWVGQHRPLGADDFVELMALPLLRALAYAHEREVVHRDVKPSNVLMADDETPKLTDFGISKVKSKLIETGPTVRDFVSRPFAPPEGESTSGFSRDVFGMGTLMMWCLADVPVRDYTDFPDALNSIDASPKLVDLIASCTALEVTERPRHAPEVLALLEDLQARRRRSWIPLDTLHLELTGAARRSIASEEDVPQADAEQLALAELKEPPAIRRLTDHDPPLPPGVRHYFIYGQTWRFHIVLEHNSPTCAVIAARRVGDSECDGFRDSCYVAKHREFTFDPVVNHASALPAATRLSNAVEEFDAEREEQRAQHEEGRLFDQWRRQLDAREAFDQRHASRVRYKSATLDGSRLRLRVEALPEENLLEQRRRVLTDDGAFLAAGVVDEVQADEVTLYLDRETSRSFTGGGVLAVDTGASQVSLRRERSALEAVKHQTPELQRPELRGLLVHPEEAAAPSIVEIGDNEWAQDLDESKRAAVVAALGSPDFLVVAGPPGTGKTSLIAELVAQTLRLDPRARVLLASQTHVALDNALHRIRLLQREIRLLRLGNPASGKVAKEVLDLTADHQLAEWRKIVARRSERYLEELASNHGAQLNVVRAALQLRQLSAIARRVNDLDAQISERKQRIEQSSALGSSPDDVLTDDEMTDLQEEISRLREQQRTLKAEARDIRSNRAAAKHFPASEDPDELQSAARQLLGEDDITRALIPLVELQADWLERLGRGPEFRTALLLSSQVVAATCIGLAQFPGIEKVPFDLCIIDEATRATATETLVPLVRATRWLLIGDERQLPPFQDKALRDRELIEEFELDEAELRRSLFGRLSIGLPPANRRMLTMQHRMVPALGDLISQCFYPGELESADVPAPTWVRGLQPRPVTWFTTHLLPNHQERLSGRDSPSVLNRIEAREVGNFLKRIDFLLAGQRVDAAISVLILAPYRAQIAELHRVVAGIAFKAPGLEVEVNTVDAAQGREADVLVFSATRSNDTGTMGFVRDIARANVALSRGRFMLAIFGDATFFDAVDSPLRAVLTHIRTHPSDCVVEELTT